MRKWKPLLRLTAVSVAGVGLIVVLMLWLSGAWSRRIAPTLPSARGSPPAAIAGLATITIRAQPVAQMGEATGTIQPEHEIALSSQLTMPTRIEEIDATPGRMVEPGTMLVRLDDRQVRKQLEQAEADLATAKAEYDRLIGLGGNATAVELTRATNALRAAGARVAEVRTVISYCTITAPAPASQPADGPHRWMVINKYAEKGDTVQPGQVLVRLSDRLQLVALVPESMRPHLEVGQRVAVHLDALDADCSGTIRQIVPQANVVSRLFQVKVVGPCQSGVIIGMSARMLAPTGLTTWETRVPKSAVLGVGQLAMVLVKRDGRLIRQFVQVIRRDGDEYVVDGLSEGDQVVRDVARAPASAE